jgi:hypothetical protein
MNYDAWTALDLAEMFFTHAIERLDAIDMFDRFAWHKYPHCKAARKAFKDRAVLHYDRLREIEPDDFGRLKATTGDI